MPGIDSGARRTRSGGGPLASDPIRVGIVGLGRSGWSNHARTLGKHPGYRVVAVADGVAERRAEAEQVLGCRAHADVAELLQEQELELVIVCTPSFTHADIATAALRTGRHVLVEKPMAASVAEVDRMTAAAREAGRVLTVFQNRRLDPDFLKVQEILGSGVLGPVHLIRMGRHGYQRRSDWQTLRRMGGGQLNNWGAHVLDQGLLLLDGEYSDIFADLQHTVSAGDAEDHVKVVLRGRSGTVLDVEITSAYAYPAPDWQIMGKYGSLTGTTGHLEWKYYDPSALPELTADDGPAAGRSYGRREDIPWQIEAADIKAAEDITVTYYNRLYATLREGAPLLVTPGSVRKQIALFDDIRNRSGF